MNNLELWAKVEKTNPEYTKKANVKGNKITAIAPQYQIKNATEQFGAYGAKWGLKDIKWNFDLVESTGLAIFECVFFFPDGEFEITNAVSLYMDGARMKPDNNFTKKCETDTLTKALSKLGFNADIFLGLFDDVEYLAAVTEEFNGIGADRAAKLEEYASGINVTATEVLNLCSQVMGKQMTSLALFNSQPNFTKALTAAITKFSKDKQAQVAE
jgi:hypothetical protein